MDLLQRKAEELQASMSSLSLEAKEAEGVSEKILLGKILTARSFSRYSLFDIVRRSWKIQARVTVEKLEDKVFKFTFDKKCDKDYIF